MMIFVKSGVISDSYSYVTNGMLGKPPTASSEQFGNKYFMLINVIPYLVIMNEFSLIIYYFCKGFLV